MIRKIVSGVVLLGLSLSSVSFVAADRINSSFKKIQTNTKEVKKVEEFEKILKKYFKKGKKTGRYGYNYNDFGEYSSNTKYNSIVKKELELIIRKTFDKNKEYYKNFFKNNNGYDSYRGIVAVDSSEFTLEKILQKIPRSYDFGNVSDILFNSNTISDNLLKSSFRVNYRNEKNYDSFLRAIDSKISRFKNRNGYYPSLKELKKEDIYLNRKTVKIGDNIEKIKYSVNYTEETENESQDYYIRNKKPEEMYSSLQRKAKLENNEIKAEILEDIEKIKNKSISIDKAKEIIKKYKKYREGNYNDTFRDMNNYVKKVYFTHSSYTLEYKKVVFTLDEALADIKKTEKLNIQKKDYNKLIGDAKLENIPEIYKKIPKDSIFLHISNPKFLFEFLEDKKNTSNSGLQILKKIRDLIQERAGVENWDEIKSNLTHEITIVLSDLDLVSPNFLLILDKKDKGILVPGERVMAAKSVGDKIYISLSKELLEDYLNLDEKDSIYYSPDFRYVWFKKQNIKKDVFFFAGDNFFEKITSFEYFIKMKRKINDYMNLKEIQDYVYALEKTEEKKVKTFYDLKQLVEFKEDKLENFEVRNSIVTHKKIGKIHDIKNISSIDYDLSKITLQELSSYKENILDYREVWQSTLDPLGIIISENKTGFEIDFFMTPIPSLKDYDLQFISQILSNFGKENFNFIKNNKLRIGIVGGIGGFDSNKLKKFIDKKMELFLKNKNNKEFQNKPENKYLGEFLEEFNEMNSELFEGERHTISKESVLDFLDGEFLISFGGIDTSIFNSWNPDKLDLIIATKFKSKLKAKEFITILRKKVVGESRRFGRNSINNKTKELLAKPLGEEYNGNTIFSVPVPYIGALYYTIIEDNVYISISKSSIHKSVDFSKKPGDTKDKFSKNYLTGEKLIYTFFDSSEIRKNLENILSDDKLTDLYIEAKRSGLGYQFENLKGNKLFIKKYYKDYELSKLTGKKVKELTINLGLFNYYTKDGEIYFSIDKNKISINNTDIKQEAEDLFKKIDKKFFTKKGGNILDFGDNEKNFQELTAINLLNSILNKEFREEIMPNNLAFSLGIGNNEIQLKMKSFGIETNKNLNSETKSKINSNKKIKIESDKIKENTNNILYIIIGLLILLILGGGFAFYTKSQKESKKVKNDNSQSSDTNHNNSDDSATDDSSDSSSSD